MDIKFKGKQRKPSTGLYKGARGIVTGRDWALQNEIDETRETTQARSCYRGCRTCGACANSKRDNFLPQARKTTSGITEVISATKSYDENSGSWIDCRSCEPFRFHDCHNGVMRDTRQEAEPFTPEQIALLESTGGKPLI